MARATRAGTAPLAELGPYGLSGAEELHRFAKACRSAWPDLVSVERRGLFNRGPIGRLVIRFDHRAYIAWSTGAGVTHEIGGVSMGVIVRTQAVHPEAWVAGLRNEFGQSGHLIDASPWSN